MWEANFIAYYRTTSVFIFVQLNFVEINKYPPAIEYRQISMIIETFNFAAEGNGKRK